MHRNACIERILGVLLDKGDKALQRTVTIIIQKFTRTGRFELESWETSNTEGNRRREIVLRSLHLGTERR